MSKADLAEISGGLTTISENCASAATNPSWCSMNSSADFDRLRADGTLDIMLQIQTRPQAPHAAPKTPGKSSQFS